MRVALQMAWVFVLLAAAPAAWAQDLRLTGAIERAQHQTYVEVPFMVPPGVERLTVAFRHDGADARTTLDLGLRDPQRFRGWSGGSRDGFTLAASDATPAYLPGPLPAGRWALVLGVPNIRPGVTTAYEAEIWFDREGAPSSDPAQAPLREGPGWWRGDLHVHSGHSDGSCRSRSGKTVPCPLFRVVETAAERGLDFIALTEHNAESHAQGLRELQPYFDDLLLVPGRELTTFQGHANLLGLTAPLAFQEAGSGGDGLASVLARAEALGAVISINHPRMPSGEACLGCGWTAEVDLSQVHAVEVLNGGAAAAFGGRVETPLSGVPFWEAQLNAGHRLTAIGGSDSHDPDRPVESAGALGRPATVIYAESLSQPALLAALKGGRVFIDLTHPGIGALDLEARLGAAHALMGGTLSAPAGAEILFEARVEGAEGAWVHVVDSAGETVALPPITSAQSIQAFTRRSDGARRWIRLDLRAADGALMAMGNPIYLNWDR